MTTHDQLPEDADLCPRCQGTGKLVHPAFRQEDPTCVICKGMGFISREICLGCGRPAQATMLGIIEFCGSEECLRGLLRQAEPKRRTYMALGPRGRPWDHPEWMGCMGEGDIEAEGYCC